MRKALRILFVIGWLILGIAIWPRVFEIPVSKDLTRTANLVGIVWMVGLVIAWALYRWLGPGRNEKSM